MVMPKQQFSRINLVELKSLIIQKIGRSKAEKYFDHLKRLFSLKLGKCEFDKFCIRVIGKENLPLHNRLIESIIKNAYLAKVPPVKPRKEESPLSVKIINKNQRSCLQSLYGDAFRPSPRKCRSLLNRGRPQTVLHEELVSKAQEQESPTELLSLGSNPPIELVSVEDGEEVEQVAGSPSVHSKSPIPSPVTAPLGISMNKGGCARKSLCNGSLCNFYPKTCHISGELPDTGSLSSRLDHKLEMEGFRVSGDCASLLNIGLDAYLKRLIEPCIGLAASKHGSERLWERNGQSIPRSICASMLDFHSAIELNPKILGEDWAVQFEKVCMRTSEGDW